ncbi:MAG TPA: hypothetical protein VGM56_23875 [Byssovorax sp.]
MTICASTASGAALARAADSSSRATDSLSPSWPSALVAMLDASNHARVPGSSAPSACAARAAAATASPRQ